MHGIFLLALVLLPQQVLEHFAALAKLLLILLLAGHETKHNLLNDTRLGESLHSGSDLRLLTVSHFPKVLIVFLLSQLCLVEKR